MMWRQGTTSSVQMSVFFYFRIIMPHNDLYTDMNQSDNSNIHIIYVGYIPEYVIPTPPAAAAP